MLLMRASAAKIHRLGRKVRGRANLICRPRPANCTLMNRVHQREHYLIRSCKEALANHISPANYPTLFFENWKININSEFFRSCEILFQERVESHFVPPLEKDEGIVGVWFAEACVHSAIAASCAPTSGAPWNTNERPFDLRCPLYFSRAAPRTSLL